MVNTPIGWHVVMNINDGQLDNFKKVSAEIMTEAQKEKGTLMYDWFISEDQKTCTVVERFAGNEGAIAHVTGPIATTLLPKLLEYSSFKDVHVVGTPNAELTKILANFPVTKRSTFFQGLGR